MASKEQKNLGLAILALLAFGAMMVWVLTDSPASSRGANEPAAADAPEPSQATPTTSPPAQPNAAPAKPSSAEAPAPPKAAPAQDLFAGELPDFMERYRALTLEKKWLDAGQQRELYEYGKTHSTDARPQLILAWDSMNREWDGIGVRMYAMAFHADKRAKDDPTMLRDLLDVASRFDSAEHREATDIIKEAYGGEAIGAIDARLAELRGQGGDLARAARLQRLRTAITGH